MANASNLIVDHLGPAYSQLDDLIQRAHTGNIRLEGDASVTRGNAVASCLCTLLRLPPSAASVRLTVLGTHYADKMLWARDFGGFKMSSRFLREGSDLFEKFGPLKLILKLTVDNGALIYTLVKTTMWGIPFPMRFAPVVSAFELQSGGLYQFGVSVSLPVLGKLIAYEGRLALTSHGGTSLDEQQGTIAERALGV